MIDFYCPNLKLAIELDGISHFFDDDCIRKDERRQKYLEKYGVYFLRFTNNEVKKHTEAVLDKISDTVKSLSNKD